MSPSRLAGNSPPIRAKSGLSLSPCSDSTGEGHRLGYGAGYYDRFLSGHPHLLKIGLAFSCLETAEVPIDAMDISMDLIITERGIIRCRIARIRKDGIKRAIHSNNPGNKIIRDGDRIQTEFRGFCPALYGRLAGQVCLYRLFPGMPPALLLLPERGNPDRQRSPGYRRDHGYDQDLLPVHQRGGLFRRGAHPAEGRAPGTCEVCKKIRLAGRHPDQRPVPGQRWRH